MTDRIKPCPFCGRKPEMRHENGGFSYIVCANDGCYVRTDGHLNDTTAITAWNTRKPMDRIVEKLEERIDFHIRLVDYEMNMGTIVDVERHKEAIKTIEKAIEIVKEGGKDV